MAASLESGTRRHVPWLRSPDRDDVGVERVLRYTLSSPP